MAYHPLLRAKEALKAAERAAAIRRAGRPALHDLLGKAAPGVVGHALVKDPGAARRGRTCDRCAGICFLDGLHIVEAMARSGLPRDCPHCSDGRYRAAELRAAGEGATFEQTYELPGYCR
jgi:hypothetical protein